MKIEDSLPSGLIRPEGPWIHRNINANGARFHVVQAGPSSSHAVLLLHGFPQYWWAMRAHLEALAAAGYNAVAMDLRGFGGSDRQPSGYDVATLTKDCIGVLTSLGISKAILVGQGIGGTLAWAAPAVAPRQVAAIVTLGAPHPLATRSLRGRAFTGGAAQYLFLQLPWLPERALRSGSLVHALMRSWAAAENRDLVNDLADRYASLFTNPFAATAALAYLRQTRKLIGAQRDLLRHRVSVPVLSLQGQVDPIMPGQAFARDAHYVAGPLTQRAIVGAGHFLSEEAPAAVNAALLSFLQELDWPTGSSLQPGK